MDIIEITDKVNKLASAWEEFKHVNDRRLKDIEKKGSSDIVDDDQLNRINQELDNYKSRLDQYETALNRPLIGGNIDLAQDKDHKNAFVQYIKKGIDRNLPELEKKYLSAHSDQDGGYLVTRQISKTIAQNIFDQSPMRKLASIEQISSDSLDIIEDLDKLGCGWTTETGTREDTDTPQISKKRINVHELYAQPKATQKLIDDASIDIERWIAKKLSDSFSMLENHSFIHGDGEGKPRGILSYDANTIEQVTTDSEQITPESLYLLFYALKENYASKASFLMNRQTLQNLRLLKDPSTGQYLWNPGLAQGSYESLLGVPVMQCADMPMIDKNTLPIAIGDFKNAYKIVDRTGIRILRDPFTDKPFVKFYATKRVGGDVVNYDAIKLLKINK